jgi:hypothetical protein
MLKTYTKMQDIHHILGCYVVYFDKHLLTTRHQVSDFAVLLFTFVRI